MDKGVGDFCNPGYGVLERVAVYDVVWVIHLPVVRHRLDPGSKEEDERGGGGAETAVDVKTAVDVRQLGIE